MAAETPKKVTVEALKYHTTAGEEYQVGDTYQVDEAAVENLTAQGMAVRVDRVAHAREQAKALTSSKTGELKPLKAGRKAAKARTAKRGK
jgi:hypothetical protein